MPPYLLIHGDKDPQVPYAQSMRFQEQMKLEEIAKLIRIPVATVKTRIYRGVNALRPLIKGGAL